MDFIELRLFSFDSDTKFRGILQFRYAVPLDDIPKLDQQKLKQLGFHQKLILDDAQGNRHTYLYASIAFNGTQYQGISTDLIQHKMSQPYPVQIAKTIIQKHKKNKVQSTAGALLMPLAIGVDIVTFPIAFGVVTYGLTHSQSPK
ncbi:hypothetical protein [Acinetobacter thermotolerans]|uniref:hypothetical protein n=1 Tax=Acinetobacter thermotolerans TaxID=3151487 RepID=UPI00325AB547